MHLHSAVGQALALAFAMGAWAAHAQSGDPLHSPACDKARAMLEHALDDASARRPGSRERLAAARKAAIDACLGPETGERERSGAPDPPIAVAPPVIEAPRAPPAPAAIAPPVPAVVIPRPAVITTCDPGGCWDSEGRRLNQLGPMIVGPRGPCVVQGGLAQCP